MAQEGVDLDEKRSPVEFKINREMDFDELYKQLSNVDYFSWDGDLQWSGCDAEVPEVLVNQLEIEILKAAVGVNWENPHASVDGEDRLIWISGDHRMEFYKENAFAGYHIGCIKMGGPNGAMLIAGNHQGHPFIDSTVYSYGNSDGSASDRRMGWKENGDPMTAEEAILSLLSDTRIIARNEEH